MAVTAAQYGQLALHLANARINYPSDTIKCMLTTSTYTPNLDTHDYKDDVTNEISGTGYSAGGVTLANKTCTYDSGTNETRWDADDPTWAGASVSGIRNAVYYKDTGVASTSPLISYVNMGGDQQVTGTTFRIEHAATGFVKFTAAAEA